MIDGFEPTRIRQEPVDEAGPAPPSWLPTTAGEGRQVTANGATNALDLLT
jgi:hypothetical protein